VLIIVKKFESSQAAVQIILLFSTVQIIWTTYIMKKWRENLLLKKILMFKVNRERSFISTWISNSAGASDDDPSGIATYSQRAQFGFGILWMALFQYPLMTVIQEMSARIGLATGSGLNTVVTRLSFH
jgi:hypothetical protein